MSPVRGKAFQPRPYQTECLQAYRDAFARGLQRPATVLPTGMGKTVIIAEQVVEFVRETGKRVAIFVHRDDLVDQTIAKIHGQAPDLTIGVVKASRNEIDTDVVIISIQTVSRTDMKRLGAIPADWFGFVIVDECHMAVAPGYMRALRYFGCFMPGSIDGHPVLGPGASGTRLAGHTATMVRADELGLGDVWEEVVYRKSILFGIRNKFLVDVRGKDIVVEELDLGGVKTAQGDFQEGSLSAALLDANFGPVVAQSILEHAPDRSTLVFTPTKETALDVCSHMNTVGIPSDVITEDTTREDRKLMYKRMYTGELQALVNCMVLTVGLDLPPISCIVVARPKKKKNGAKANTGLYTQMVGRGLRPWDGNDPSSSIPWVARRKTDCLVLHVVGGEGQVYGLCTTADLSETPLDVKEDESLSEAVEREAVEKENISAEIKALAKIHATDLDLFSASSELWMRTTKHGYWFLPVRDWVVAVLPESQEPDTTFMVGRIYTGFKPMKHDRVRVEDNLPLAYAKAYAEDVAGEMDPAGTIRARGASWRKKKREAPTTPQVDYCCKLIRELRASMGITYTMPTGDDFTKVNVSDLISTMVGTKHLDNYTPPATNPHTQ